MMKKQGMTLVEVVIVCCLIGVLTAIALPATHHVLQKKKNATIASQWRLAAQAFELCKMTTGSYPADTGPGVVPTGMQTYFNELNFTEAGLNWTTCRNIMGGRWDWDLGQFGVAAGVSVYQPSATPEQMAVVDSMMDDGSLLTGSFRRRCQGYILIMED